MRTYSLLVQLTILPWLLRRQRKAGVLRNHICGVPVWPVRVGLTGALLVFAVRCGRSTKRARQVRCGCECRSGGVDPAGQPSRDLLQEPAVAVRIVERGEGAVAGVIG